MIAIIDYDAGNIKSVEKAFDFLGAKTVLTKDPEVILSADKAVLPGVGSFGEAMNRIHEYGLYEVIHKFVDSGKPFMGICLGLQLMFDYSEESPGVKGLSLLPGGCKKFQDEVGKVPQIGWNQLSFPKESKLFSGLKEGSFVYFVHSYYLDAQNKDDVAALCNYGITFDAAIEHENLYACQFHPEKSSDVGLKILKNFIEL